MTTFLFKTEPGEYSFSDLQRDKRCIWTGVSNPAALINLRAVRKGDEVFIYHTGAERRVVGAARVLAGPYEDPKRPGKTPKGEPKFAVVDLAPAKAAKKPLSLDEIKADASLNAPGFDLVRLPRLSVMPVPEQVAREIRVRCGL